MRILKIPSAVTGTPSTVQNTNKQKADRVVKLETCDLHFPVRFIREVCTGRIETRKTGGKSFVRVIGSRAANESLDAYQMCTRKSSHATRVPRGSL